MIGLWRGWNLFKSRPSRFEHWSICIKLRIEA